MSSQSMGAAGDQGAGSPRVLLLLDAAGDRRVLASWLRGGHTVVEPARDADPFGEPYDLCLLDDHAFARLWTRMAEQKRASEPVFLPFVLLTSRTSAHLVSEVPTHEIDETLDAPVGRDVLVSRVDVLLGRRRRELDIAEELRENLQLTTVLNHINELLLSTHDRDEVFGRALEAATRALGSDYSVVSLKGEPDWTIAYSYRSPLAPGTIVPAERAKAAEQIARSGELFATEDALNDERLDGPYVKTLGVRAFMHVPLVAGGEFVGILSFHNVDAPRRFTRPQIAFAEHVGSGVSLALGSARLFEALRTSKERFEILSEANGLLLSSPDPEAAVRTIAERVKDQLGADVFFNYMLDAGAEHLRLNAWGGVDERVAKMIERLEPGQAICGCVAQGGERIISEDVQNNGDPRADLVRRMGIRCYCCHPLKAAGRTVGTLSFGTKRKDCFDTDEIELMRTVSNQVSVAIERVRSEQESLFQSYLLESVSDSVIAYYPDEPDRGKLVYVNEAAHRTRGFSREEMLRLNVTELIAPQWRDRLQGRLDKIARGEEVRGESAHLRKDGTTFPVEVWLSGIEFGGRSLVVNVSRDITERKRFEQGLQEEAARTKALLAAANTLGRWTDVQSVVEQLARNIMQATGRKRVWVRLYDERRHVFRTVLSIGSDKGPAVGDEIRLEDMAAPAQETFVRRRALVSDIDALPPGQRGPFAEGLGLRCFVSAPMYHGDRPLGAIGVDDPDEHHEFGAEEISLIEAIIAQSAVAVENARLFEAEVARSRRERVLKDILAAATASLDLRETGALVVERLRQELDDASVMILLANTAGESLEVLAQAGYAPDLVQKMTPLALSTPTETTEAFRTGAPRYLADAVGSDATPSTRELAELQSLRAAANVPISLHGSPIGVLALAWPRPRSFSEEERSFLESLASEVALGISNARAYQSEHDIADRLQEALLALPDSLPGLDFAASYHSAAEAARVGGDFYDLFEIAPHLVGITIGDVAGKGLDAAVLTSLVKNTIRAHANDADASPSSILNLANDVILKSTPTEAFVTVFFGTLDCESGRLAYASAGHTTGAIRHADGGVEPLPASGPLLGAFAGMTFASREATVETGEAVFLYTDGLTEARRDHEQYGEQRVMAVLSATEDTSPPGIIRAISADVMSFAGGDIRDDVALLAVKRVEPGAETARVRELRLR